MQFLPTALILTIPVCLAGCQDHAKPGFGHCQQLQKQGKLAEARRACDLAKAMDPESHFGKLARAEMPRIDARITELEAEEKRALSDLGKLKSELPWNPDGTRSEDSKARLEAAEERVRHIQMQLLGRLRQKPLGCFLPSCL
jgi:hypothetical protein